MKAPEAADEGFLASLTLVGEKVVNVSARKNYLDITRFGRGALAVETVAVVDRSGLVSSEPPRASICDPAVTCSQTSPSAQFEDSEVGW